MQDITDDCETEDTYIPTDEADSTMYYDTEASPIHDEEANTSSHNEAYNAPQTNIPTDMIQMNDSLTVSTVTNDAITQTETPTAVENDQLASLSEVDEEEDQDEASQRLVNEVENQDEASQRLEHNMEPTMDTSQDENIHNDGQQNNIEQTPVDTTVDTTLDNEMSAKYGTRTTRWNLRQ